MTSLLGKPIVGQTPTFLLRKVDPMKILEDYRNGKYVSYTLPEKKVEVSAIPTSVQPTVGTSQEDDIFAFRLRNNTIQTVATTNHRPYTLYNLNGQEMPIGGECEWCKDTFAHEALGIPIRSAEIVDASGKKTAYYMEDIFCSFECVFAMFKKFCGVNYRSRDPIYMNSESLLRHLYNICHPNAGPLREAPDFRLRKRRGTGNGGTAPGGGPLDSEEFKSRKHTYIRTPNVILAPVKIQYYKKTY